MPWTNALAASVLLAAAAFAQPVARTEDVAAGRFLIASNKLPDPNFAETVVLIIQHDDKGTAGLIVNRQTRIPLSRVFQELSWAKDLADPVYAGGPVERGGVHALLRCQQEPANATRLLRGVCVAANKQPVERALAARAKPTDFRVYLGYSGWGAGKLAKEIELGAWYVLPANAASVFDPDPDTLWSRLMEQTERRIARAFTRSAAPESGPPALRAGLE